MNDSPETRLSNSEILRFLKGAECIKIHYIKTDMQYTFRDKSNHEMVLSELKHSFAKHYMIEALKREENIWFLNRSLLKKEIPSNQRPKTTHQPYRTKNSGIQEINKTVPTKDKDSKTNKMHETVSKAQRKSGVDSHIETMRESREYATSDFEQSQRNNNNESNLIGLTFKEDGLYVKYQREQGYYEKSIIMLTFKEQKVLSSFLCSKLTTTG